MAGVTNTPALRKIPNAEKMVDVARGKNPMNRLTTPEDIAAVISALCIEGCHWISGGVIQADGGENSVSYVGQS
jgi:NAD(P)-dependent dehydrogenase (short-subunit alcohol dehydrogenase family)